MAIIKSNNAAAMLKDAVVLDLGDIGRQAKALREKAQQQADQLLRDAQAQARQIIDGAEAVGLEQGKAAGFEQGLAEGREQGKAQALAETTEQLAQLQQAWVEAAQQWEAQQQQLHREARQDVLKLAVMLAHKVVHRVVEQDNRVAVEQVAAALSHVLRSSDVTVRICPDDRQWVDQALPDVVSSMSQLQHVQLIDDPQVGKGGCVVSFGQGRIDATIETQLSRIAALLLPSADADEQASAPEQRDDADER